MKSSLPLFPIFAVASMCFSLHSAETNSVSKNHTAEFARFHAVDPKDAEKTFQVLDGFQMQLIAAEPLVTDPVAMVYDENGRAYVVEMNDYPYTDKNAHQAWKDNTTDKPIGKIRLLEDTDGDGKFDKSTVFAENLSWPSGICCWKGGVYVTATPDIWYLKDTDGDRRADVRQKVFTGFRKYNVQAVMNNPIWGLDNHIYIAGSSNGGEITSPNKTNSPVKVLRHDFRVDPVTEKFEAVSGGARFGNAFDDWGHRFLCNIRNPAQQVVLDTRYFARNPFAPVPNPVVDIRESGDALPVFRISPVEPWREARAKLWTAENKNTPRSELSGGGVFTSASGITVYRGAAYPPEFHGNAFVCEVANNVIQRQTMTNDGVVYKAERIGLNAEFIASTDTWFRPVNFVNAPDGTLHICDMYRETIEHPWSIPDDIRAKIDLESGRDRGRIYRLAPPNYKVPKPPQLGQATLAELVATLENPNAWWRETAQRLLFERQDKTAVEPLRRLIAQSQNPLARLHALWTLEGLGALTEAEIAQGLDDDASGVRENALKLAESRLEKSTTLADKVFTMAVDPEVRVRFQVALAIGGLGSRKPAETLLKIAKSSPTDPWIRAAVTSADPDICRALTGWLVRDEHFASTDEAQTLLHQLTFVVGAENRRDSLYELLGIYNMVHYCHCFIRESFYCGLGDGLRQAGHNFRTAFPNTNSVGTKMMNALMNTSKEEAVQTESLKKRRLAVKFLGYGEFADGQELLPKLLDAREPQELQIDVVRALSGFKNPEVTTILLKPWSSYTPAVREAVVNALFARKDRLKPLLDAIESGAIAPSQINATRQAQLLAHADQTIKKRAAQLLGQNISASRKEALEKYKTALSLSGNAANGLKVFAANCAVCHRSGDQGTDLGPNLETVRSWDGEKILMNILDPNREVAPNYLSYEIELKDGSSFSGLIASETDHSLLLKRANAPEETILRQNIDKMTSSGLSIMPEGLEANIPPQDMADLLAFLLGRN